MHHDWTHGHSNQHLNICLGFVFRLFIGQIIEGQDSGQIVPYKGNTILLTDTWYGLSNAAAEIPGGMPINLGVEIVDVNN